MQRASYQSIWLNCEHASIGNRPAKSTGVLSRLLFFLAPSTGLLDGRTFLLVLEKITSSVFDFFLQFLFIFCVDSFSDNRLAAACN